MDALIAEINTLYGLNLSSPEKVERGFLTENHVLVSGGAKYFLKKYSYPKEEKIKEIHLAKQFFADKGIPIILPMTHKNGSTFFLFEGVYFALFPFVAGRHIESEELSEKAIVSLGRMLAKIHLAGKDSSLPITSRIGTWDKDSFIKKAEVLIEAIEQNKEPSSFDELALRNMTMKKSLIESNTATAESLGLPNDHLIHGDYHEQNVFFTEDDEISDVFDLEKVAYAPRTFEVVRSLMYIFWEDDFTAENIEKGKIYLRAYAERYPISKEELKQGLRLYYLRQLHGFWVETEHYLNHNYRVDQFLESGHNIIKYLSENIDGLGDGAFDY
jgi:homoserine kinase type II